MLNIPAACFPAAPINSRPGEMCRHYRAFLPTAFRGEQSPSISGDGEQQPALLEEVAGGNPQRGAAAPGQRVVVSTP